MNWAALLPILCSFAAAALSIWNVWYVRVQMRRRGRQAVAEELTRRGEAPVRIEPVPFSTVHDRAGLVSACVFEVEAKTAEGEPRTYLLAYEPGLITTRRRPPLKRLAHGVWIPA